jgi:hypothetical protein
MEWPLSRRRDRAFGPRFPGQFDFTLYFEHLILTVIPFLMFMLMAICRVLYLYRKVPCARAGAFSWVKVVCSLISMPDNAAV